MDISLPILLQPTSSPAIPAVGTNPNTGGATSILPMLQDISLGTMLKGNVTQPKNAQGHVVITTDKGDLALKTDIPMKRGIEVVIRLEKATDELMAKIISIDSKSVAKYVESVQGEAENKDTITRSNLLQTGDPNKAAVTTQTVLKAVLVALPPAPANTPAAPAPDLSGNVAASAAPRILTQQGMTPLLTGAKITLTLNTIQLPTQAEPHAGAQAPQPQKPAQSSNQPLRSAISSGIAAYRNLMGAQTPLPVMPPPQQPHAAISSITSQPAPPLPTAQAPLPSPTTAAQQPEATASQPLPQPTAATVIAQPQQAANAVANTPPQTPAATAQPAALETQHTPQTAATPSPPTPAQALPHTQTIISTPTTPPTQPEPSAPQHPTQTTATPALPSVNAPANPLAAASTPNTPNPTNTIHATVIQSDVSGDMTLHSDVGTLKLFSPTPLPTGSILSLNVQQVENPETPEIVSADGTARTPKFAGMESLATTLPPPTGADFTPSPLARTGKEMLADISFLFTAIKGGDMKKWLGDKTMKRLSADGKTDILARLSSEFQNLKQVNTEPKDAGGWHHYMIPVNVEGQVEPLRFFHRHQDNQQEKEKDGSKPRMEATDHFIVGVELSHLGEIQLDGFIRKHVATVQEPKRTAFELVIRSTEALPTRVEKEIRDIFISAQEITGFTGNLSFRSGTDACLPLPQTGALIAHNTGTQSLIV